MRFHYLYNIHRKTVLKLDEKPMQSVVPVGYCQVSAIPSRWLTLQPTNPGHLSAHPNTGPPPLWPSHWPPYLAARLAARSNSWGLPGFAATLPGPWPGLHLLLPLRSLNQRAVACRVDGMADAWLPPYLGRPRLRGAPSRGPRRQSGGITSGTRRLNRKALRPIFSVLIWVMSELFCLTRPLYFARAFPPNTGSLAESLAPPPIGDLAASEGYLPPASPVPDEGLLAGMALLPVLNPLGPTGPLSRLDWPGAPTPASAPAL